MCVKIPHQVAQAVETPSMETHGQWPEKPAPADPSLSRFPQVPSGPSYSVML